MNYGIEDLENRAKKLRLEVEEARPILGSDDSTIVVAERIIKGMEDYVREYYEHRQRTGL